MTLSTILDLREHFNATSSTFNDTRHLGRANAWGNSFPAEELPLGQVMTVASVPFLLPAGGGRERDNIEAWGQVMDFPKVPPLIGLAVLCYGEMGEQALPICALGMDGQKRSGIAVADGWLIEKDASVRPDGHAFSHLHYNDGFEFDALHPVLWCWTTHWNDPFELQRLILGVNPLFHIAAITCLHG